MIEDIAASPVLSGAVQIRINTTDYFQNPDVTNMDGIPGLASPYPRGANSTLDLTSVTASTVGSENILKSFDLYPDVYVLPGQTFQILYTTSQLELQPLMLHLLKLFLASSSILFTMDQTLLSLTNSWNLV